MSCKTHHFACDCREAKFRRLYVVVNEAMLHMGVEGEISVRSTQAEEIMAALYELDGGFIGARRGKARSPGRQPGATSRPSAGKHSRYREFITGGGRDENH